VCYCTNVYITKTGIKLVDCGLCQRVVKLFVEM
jgi:hypothetical protein